MKNILLIFALIVIAFGAYVIFKPNDEKISIVIMGEDTANIQSLMELEDKYEKLNPEIDLIFKPNSLGGLDKKALEDLRSNKSNYDIILQYGHALATYVEKDFVYDIDEVMEKYGVSENEVTFEDDLFQNVWKSISWYYEDDTKSVIDKVVYPCSANTTLLVYNKEMFENENNKVIFKEKYGYDLIPPSTWKEFYDVSEFFTNKDKGIYGVALEGEDEYIYYEWLQFLYSFDGKILDTEYPWSSNKNTEVVINSKEALNALEYFLSLKNFTPSFLDITQYKEMDYLSENKVAMILSWDDGMYSQLTDKNGLFDQRFGYAPIPGDKSPTHGGSFFINKDSQHPKEALSFILFVLQLENQIFLAKKGLSVPNKAVYELEEIKSLPRSEALLTSINRGGVYYDAGLDSEVIQVVLATYLQKAWKNELSASEALQKMEKEIKDRRSTLFN